MHINQALLNSMVKARGLPIHCSMHKAHSFFKKRYYTPICAYNGKSFPLREIFSNFRLLPV